MDKLSRNDLYSLEQYSEVRDQFRSKVMEHKRNRRLPLGTNATLYFEDRLTIQYQVQEMLRIERIFEAAGIQAGTRCLQSADTGWQQLESHLHGRVSG